MSYTITDRHGATAVTYGAKAARFGPADSVGTGKTWWPDFGPSIRDHSYQEKYMPHHHIFDKVVKPWNIGHTAAPPLLERQPTQFRHPAPGREAMMMKDQPTHECRLAAKAITDRQGALRMMEVRQRKMDSWLEDCPMRMVAAGSSRDAAAQGLRGARSEPSLTNAASTAAATVSRETYEKLGFLVGRSKGSIADGLTGAHGSTRKHNPLSVNALMFSGNVVDGSKAKGSSRSQLPKKPSKQWNVLPESSFVFDPRSSLPVPRGGWNAQPPTQWPEAPLTRGSREWSAPVTFDARRNDGPRMEALLEAPREFGQSPSAIDRKFTAGSQASSVQKDPYGTVREPGQQTQGLGASALSSTLGGSNLGKSASFGSTGNMAQAQ